MIFVDIFLYVILPLLLVAFLFLKKKFSFFEDNGIPHIKPSSWITGNVGDFGKKIHFAEFIHNLYAECKGKDVIAGFYGMFIPSFIVTDLELVKQITVKEFNIFTDRGMFVNEEKEPLTAHLFSLEGEKWRFLRNKLSPVFTSGKIKIMFTTISDKGTNLVRAIEKASSLGSVEVKDMSNRFTIDVISTCAFGMETNTLNNENSEVENLFKRVFGGGDDLKKHILVGLFPRVGKFLNVKMVEEPITKFFYDVVGGAISYREKNSVNRNDLLDMLIQLKNKGSIEGEISSETRKLTLDECLAQAFIFFFAGADTSSNTIAYAIIELGLNQDIQTKLRDEIRAKSASSNGEINYDNLQEMTYLNQVLNGNESI